MKGVVFNLLEACVRSEHGEDLWDDLLDAAGLEGAYTSLGSYDDGQLVALLAAASEALGLSPCDVERWFGRAAMRPLAQRYSSLFAPHRSTGEFLLTLNDIIHPEVRKLYPGADVPDFVYEVVGGERLDMRYRSPRRMCAFAEGLILGAADHFAERVTVEQPECMRRGADSCLLRCHLQGGEPDE